MATKQLKIQIDSNIPKVVKDFQDLSMAANNTGSASQKFGASFTIEAKHVQQALLDLQAMLKGTGIQLDSLKSKELISNKGINEAHISFQLLGADLIKVRQLLDQLNTSYANEKGFKAGSNIFSINPASLSQLQKDLLISSRMKLEALDRDNLLTATKTKYGEASNQAIRQKALNEIARLEQEQLEKLNRIRERVFTGNISDTGALLRSQRIVQEYSKLIATQQALTSSTEQLKTAHISLFKFIGTSILYWNIWHQGLYRTLGLLKAIPSIGMELETSKSVLSATMGGQSGAEVALRGLHEEAKRTGIEIAALRETWRTFSASTTIAGESINTSWSIFTKMNTVITALHYNGDKASHIFMALAQMFNKGKIQSEELVKQLGNLLPGAFAAMAEATGHTTMELVQLMKKGQFMATGNLEQFADYYSKRFAGAFIPASKSLNSEIGRMKTSFTELAETVYGKVSPNLISGAKAITSWLDSTKDGISGTNDWNTSLTVMSNSFSIFKTVVGVSADVITIAAKALKLMVVDFKDVTSSLALMYLSYRIFTPIANAFVRAGGTVTGAITAITAAIKTLNPAIAAVSSAIAIGVYFESKTEHFDKEKTLAANLNNVIVKMREQLAAEEPLPLKVAIEKDSAVVEAKASISQIKERIAALEELKKVSIKFPSNFSGETLIPGSTFFKDSKYEKLLSTANIPYIEKSNGLIATRLKNVNARLAAARFDLEDLQKTEVKAREAAEAVELGKRGATVDVEGLTRATSAVRELKKAYVNALPDDTVASIKERTKIALEELNIQGADFTTEVVSKAREKLAKAIKVTQNILQEKETKITSMLKSGVNKSFQGNLEYQELERQRNDYKKTLEGQQEHQKALLEGEELLAKRTRQVIAEEGKKTEVLRKRQTSEAIAAAQQQITNALADLEQVYGSKQEDIKVRLSNLDKDATKTEIQKAKEKEELNKQAIANLQQRIEATKELVNLEKQQVGRAITGGDNFVESSLAKSKYFDKMNEAFLKAEATYGVSANILKSIAYVENRGVYNPNAISPAGARGLMQIMPSNFAHLNIKDPFNIEQSIMGAATLLKELLNQSKGDILLAAAGYNAGWSRVAGTKVHPHEPRIPNIPETRTYVDLFNKAYGVTSKEQAFTSNASKTLGELNKQLQDLQGNSESYTTVIGNVFKTFSEQAAKASEELLVATGNESKAQATLHNKYRESLKLADELLKVGSEEQKKKVLQFKAEIDQLEAIRKEKQRLAEIGNQQIINLQSYKDQLAEVARLEQAGMLGGLHGMLAKDAANRGLLEGKQMQLSQAEATLNSIAIKDRTPGNTLYIQTFEQIAQLKNEIKDLALVSKSTMTFAAQSIGNAFDTTFRGVLDGSIKAKDAFKQFGLSVLKTLQDIILQELKSQIIKIAFSGLSSIAGSFFGAGGGLGTGVTSSHGGGSVVGGSFANGGAFSDGNIIPFAKGGIVSQPTLFKFAKGTGLMGEAGAEAIMPLARDSSGRLGVRSGGSSEQVTISNIYNITVTQAKDATAEQTGEEVLKQVKQFVEATVDGRVAKASRPGGQLNRNTKFG